jgi:hypothetical protein
MLVTRLVLIAGLAMAPVPAVAETVDTFLAGGIFPLSSHPDGGIAPPLYGLRLDGLDGDSGHEFTFDFEGPGAQMLMEIDGDDMSLRIFGQAFGGRVEDEAYIDPQVWDIDFTYAKMIPKGDRLIADPNTPPNTGTITPMGLGPSAIGGFPTGVPIDLVDYSGDFDFTFALEEGHRGGDGFSGYGWLNHSPGGLQNHVSASDWLFTVVPEPRTDALLAVGLCALIAAGKLRRRLHARTDGCAVKSVSGTGSALQ